MRLASRLTAIKPSPTLALNARARALAQAGEDVVSFAAGEPDFDTPQFIKDAAVEALRTGFTKYTATAGIPELRAAISEKLRRENRLGFTPEQVLVTCGAKHALYNLFQALLNEGDEVILFSPYWVSYPEMVQLACGRPVVLETREEDGFAPDPDALRRALTPRTRAVVFNSPSNPSGAVISRDRLADLGHALHHHDCLVVTDDIYEKLLYVEGPFINVTNAAPFLAERTVVINGMSKAFAMTGWRLGYAAGPRALIAAMQTIQDQSTSNAPSMVQKAALAALQGPADVLAPMVSEYRARRDLFVEGLNRIPGLRCRLPEGAFYVLPRISGLFGRAFRGTPLTSSVQVSELLLDHYRLAAVPGLPFGAEGFLRLSFATSRANIEKGLKRLGEFVAELE
ncbi:MAG: pyridoxal phosphate-dependent aminotransferase [Myxococcaceae bacterium]|nr:pyridoxal phosphate-dependent aminotransferase [Myxococcaceae bacterium]